MPTPAQLLAEALAAAQETLADPDQHTPSPLDVASQALHTLRLDLDQANEELRKVSRKPGFRPWASPEYAKSRALWHAVGLAESHLHALTHPDPAVLP